jgi:ribosomal protein L12E/L44/L45/RPP1/RPP2
MARLIIIFFNILAVLSVGFFQPSDVSMKMEVPSQVVAGDEFEVRITLKRGDVESFSRFQMEIPAGLTATSSSQANADFSFSDKRVRMIWLRLPDPREFTFSFKIKVDERLKGDFTLDGQFSYIFNNERQTAYLSPQAVSIQPSPKIDPSLIVDISEFEEKVVQYIPPVSEDAANIACIRQKPFLNETGSEYIVNILVSKQDKKKFAKVEELIPDGYNAVAFQSSDAIFTFKNQKVKFLWMNLPASPNFNIKYRLIPKNGTRLTSPDISGTFSFMAGDKTISVDIMQSEENIENLSEMEIQNLIAELKSKPVTVPAKEPAIAKVQPAEEQKPDVTEPVSRMEEKKPEVRKQVQMFKSEDLAYLLEPETGVYYRVQVAAGHKPVDIKKYFKKFNLDLEVRKEVHEGWIKYSVGSFNIYRDARDYRVHIWNTTVIDDAFVSAYNNGKRITVQEALMIADQKWYK